MSESNKYNEKTGKRFIYNDSTQKLSGNAAHVHDSLGEGTNRCMGCMELYSDEYDMCPFCGFSKDWEVENALHMYPGTLLHEKYIIGRVIGYGGFGVTYLAWDTVLEIKVAIKEYLPSEFSTRAIGQSEVTVFSGDKTIQFNDGMGKFIDEAKRLAKFRNEKGIVKIFDSFNENGTAYIAMEYLHGETLKEKLDREKTIPYDEAVQMLLPIVDSLKRVHEEGIIHRDIAPDNIFLTDDGDVKLIDFGAARYATTTRSRSLTVIIKPGYSAEEQYRSRGDQGPHTDVYSVGACIYKMITGQTPPDAMERRAQFEKNHRDMLVPIKKFVKDIDPNKENAIYNALNVRIEDRTADMVNLEYELTTDEPIKRRRSGIKKIDPLTWPLWAKIGIPSALAAAVVLCVLFAAGVIGPTSNLGKDYFVPDNMSLVPNIVGYNLEKAENKLKKNQLEYTIQDRVVNDKIERDLVLLQDPDAFNVVNINSFVSIVMSDGHGMGVVPDVANTNKDAAIERLEQEGFVVKIKEKEHETIAAGTVISQSVEAGTLLEKQSEIEIVVSTGNSKIDKTVAVKIPDFTGKTEEEVKQLIAQNKLTYEFEYDYNPALPVGKVIGQNPVANEVGHQGDKIIITINKGEEKIVIGSYVQKQIDGVQKELKDKGLIVYTVYKDSENYSPGAIMVQNVAPGTAVSRGSTITLTVSKGKNAKVPNVVGLKLDDAEDKFGAAKLNATVKYQKSASIPKDVVISQSVKAGTELKVGSTVVLVVSSGTENVVVDNSSIISLTISSYPSKTIYELGERFNKSGLKVIADYADGSSKDVTSLCTFNVDTFTTSGSSTVIVTYKEQDVTKTASFTVFVKDISVSLNTNSVTISKGDSVTIIATPSPSNLSVTWSSNSSSVATVSGGRITGVSVGDTLVTATVRSGSTSYKQSCSVHVVANDISVQSVTLSDSSKSLYVGDSYSLVATTLPTNATNAVVSWSSSSSNVTVDNKGTIKAVSPGSAVITAKTANGKSDTCSVTVKELAVTKISVLNYKNTYYTGQPFSKSGMILDVEYENGTHQSITDTNQFTCTMSGDTKTNGYKTVTVKYKDKTTTIKVLYEEASVTVRSSTGKNEVYAGLTLKLVADTNPDDMPATSWHSNNDNIATVNQNGVVTGIKPGSVVITASNQLKSGTFTVKVVEKGISEIKMKNRPNKTMGYYIGEEISKAGLSATVTYSDGTKETISGDALTLDPRVVEADTKTVNVYSGKTWVGSFEISNIKTPYVKLDKSSHTFRQGETVTLRADTYPVNSGKVTWSDSGHVTVDSNGRVTAGTPGTGKVTAIFTYNGKTYQAECQFTVEGETVKTIKSVSVYTKPNKTSGYVPGEKIDTSGMALKVNYSDNSYDVVYSGFRINPTTIPSSGSSCNVSVTYDGYSTSYSITGIITPKITVTNSGDISVLQTSNSHATINISCTPSDGDWDIQWSTSGKYVTVAGNGKSATVTGVWQDNNSGVMNAEQSVTIKAYLNGIPYTTSVTVRCEKVVVSEIIVDKESPCFSKSYSTDSVIPAGDIKLIVKYEGATETTNAVLSHDVETAGLIDNGDGTMDGEIEYGGNMIDIHGIRISN